jgi:deoxycytidylate deaminase
MNNRDLKYFEITKAVSELSNFQRTNKISHRIHVGAIIVLKNEIIATGYNKKKTHPLQAMYAIKADNPKAIYMHAEMSCLSKLVNDKRDLSNSKIFIFRQSSCGKLLIAKPCSICELAIRDFGINKVYYTTSDGYYMEVYK